MTTEYTGRGDPARSMDLLWGTHPVPSRGPRPGLTVERIVRAAIGIADREGLEGLSMRRIADELGVGTMSLYTYVPGKAELLDVMLDRVVGDVAFPDRAGGGWRKHLERIAAAQWDMYRTHPWLLRISQSRAVFGPNVLEAYDASLRSVSGLGLSGREMMQVVSLVAGYVRGVVLEVVDAEQAERRTGISTDDWWLTHYPLIEQRIDPERFPLLTSPELEGAYEQPEGGDPDYLVQLALDNFEFGLQRVLDGIEALVERRRDRPARRVSGRSARSRSRT
jgi:AcrR family transcriptional regulator